MDPKEELKNIADFVVDLLTDERGPRSDSDQPQPVDPNAELFQTNPALADALDRTAPDRDDDNPVSSGGGLRSMLGGDDDGDPVAKVAQVAKAAPVAKAAAPQPVREVVHNVVRERVIAQPKVTRVTEQHTSNTFRREGDQIVDNSVINNVNAQGEDIEIGLNQDIAARTVIADDGGIAAGDDIEGSALNTGRFDGAQAGDDVDAGDGTIGDENTDVSDSDIGALAEDGDATNLDADDTDTDDEDSDERPGKPAGQKSPTDVLKEDVELDLDDKPTTGGDKGPATGKAPNDTTDEDDKPATGKASNELTDEDDEPATGKAPNDETGDDDPTTGAGSEDGEDTTSGTGSKDAGDGEAGDEEAADIVEALPATDETTQADRPDGAPTDDGDADVTDTERSGAAGGQTSSTEASGTEPDATETGGTETDDSPITGGQATGGQTTGDDTGTDGDGIQTSGEDGQGSEADGDEGRTSDAASASDGTNRNAGDSGVAQDAATAGSATGTEVDLDRPANPLDTDGDGLIDNPELLDTDADGVLDNPEQFDTNGDGLIDRPDLLDLDQDGEADLLLRPADTFGGEDDLDLDD